MKNTYGILAAAAVVMGIAISPAYAYLDPGTGSIILQGIIGGVAAALFVFRSYLYRLKAWLGVGSKQQKDEPPAK